MIVYSGSYPRVHFEVLAIEEAFSAPIIKPTTEAVSRIFVLAHKVDGIVPVGKDQFMLEDKTADQISADILGRLWTDIQITIYAYYVASVFGIPILDREKLVREDLAEAIRVLLVQGPCRDVRAR
jgi:hypothetical protein